MRVDQHAQHAERLIILNKSHSPHVGRQIVDLADSLTCRVTFVAQLQVGNDILYVVEHLVPLFQRFYIHAADSSVTFIAQSSDEVSPNKATTARYQEKFISHFVSFAF